MFEKLTSEEMFPNHQDGSFGSNFKLGFESYLSLLRKKRQNFPLLYGLLPTIGISPALFVRVAVGALTMFFQQWTGINAVRFSLILTSTFARASLYSGLVLCPFHLPIPRLERKIHQPPRYWSRGYCVSRNHLTLSAELIWEYIGCSWRLFPR